MAEEAEKRHEDKTCSDCRCRNCSPITAMAERVDAYKAAQSLLKGMEWPEDAGPTPHEVLVLANWLYEGSGDEGD
jgi:hypothetical protein